MSDPQDPRDDDELPPVIGERFRDVLGDMYRQADEEH